jgi:hypothetical protein
MEVVYRPVIEDQVGTPDQNHLGPWVLAYEIALFEL